MDKTLKQIADELSIDKQKVYRYVKKEHIKEAYQSDTVYYFDEVAQNRIKSHFEVVASSEKTHEKSGFDALLKQLEVKDEQIKRLQDALDQAQKLQALTQAKLQAIEDKQEKAEKRSFFRLFRKE